MSFATYFALQLERDTMTLAERMVALEARLLNRATMEGSGPMGTIYTNDAAIVHEATKELERLGIDADTVLSSHPGTEDIEIDPSPTAGSVQFTVEFTAINDVLEIGTYPVTRFQYREVMGRDPSHFADGSESCPVESVTWHDAAAFCKRLGCRLPTEEEWDAACGEIPTDIEAHAWVYENSDGRTHPVGQKKANALGLYDMVGTVWEWTSSGSDSARVLRGGSWIGLANYCRSACRINGQPSDSNSLIGFRVARARKP